MTTTLDPDQILVAVTVPKLVTFDIYRDVHKAIRNEMFEVTMAAGSLDPDDRLARREHVARVHALIDLLVHHAEHEDVHLDIEITRVDPALMDAITVAHDELEAALVRLGRLADASLVTDDGRAGAHALYLELAAFTGAYLQHQDFEERVVMRAMCGAYSVEELIEIHTRIVTSIEPQLNFRFTALMLPAINVVDRVEVLGGMRATMPPEVFDGVWAMAGNVLSTREYLATAARLGLPVDVTT